MIARAARLLSFLLPMLALATCGPLQSTEVPQETAASQVPLPEQWTSTASPLPNPTPFPSETPLPTRVPLNDLTEISNLPSWLKTPDTPVILENRGKGVQYDQVVAVNASSGERFDFPFFAVGRYLWLDAMRIEFTGRFAGERSGPTRVLNLADGSLQAAEPTAQLPYTGGLGMSFDGRYVDNHGGIYGELSVLDQSSGREIQLTSSGDGYHFGGVAAWSPTEPLIAELEQLSPPTLDDSTPDRLAVWDARSGRRVAVIDGQFAMSSLFWSPNGKDILFLEHIDDDPLGAKPCLLNLSTGRATCLPGLHSVDPSLDYLLPWSPTGEKIRFLTCDLNQSSILTFDIQRSEATLLSDGFLEDRQRRIVSFKPSPDDRRLLIAHDEQCPPYETRPGSPTLQNGILDLETGAFHPLSSDWHWSNEVIYWATADRDFLWRPLPSESSTPPP